MRKSRSAVVDYAVYLLVRVAACVIQALPLPWGCALARFLGWLGYHIDRRHRRVALDNLRQAFPGRYTEAELEALVRQTYRHFCRVLVEILHLPRLVHKSQISRYAELADDEPTRAAIDWMLAGRSAILVTGHFGNWEMAGYILGLLGFQVHAIARPIDNPFVDAYLRRFRESTGQRVLAKKGEYDEIQTVLARGGVLGTLGDQDAGQRGLFVDFFGRPASTHKAIALLALEYRVPLIVAGAARVAEPLYYRTSVEEVIWPHEYDGRGDAVRAVTQRFTAALERLVRRYPEQYFWLHRRWKHQPATKQRRAA